VAAVYLGIDPGLSGGLAVINAGVRNPLATRMPSIDVPCEEVLPSRWQQGLHISPRKKSEGRVLWKNRLKANAQRLFPEIADKITLATADALLLAEYCRRLRQGRL
jgi:hypothetical protein